MLTALITYHFLPITTFAQPLTLVELNCENLFDTRHDPHKQDEEYLPNATRHWTSNRYWRKLNNTAQELLSVSKDGIPDIVALCEVENDTVAYDLCHKSLLRGSGYKYLITSSPDVRGIDVALLYSPFSFALINWHAIRVTPCEKDMRPTRDILYACGQTVSGDTLHVYVVHAPSRYGGERYSRPFRLCVMDRLNESIDSVYALHPHAHIVVAGDFNDNTGSPTIAALEKHHLTDITRKAKGDNGVAGTYRYQGKWDMLDHVLVSPYICNKVDTVFIHAPRFLLEEDEQYGGYRPLRTYNGYHYQPGYSDHLPLVVRFRH